MTERVSHPNVFELSTLAELRRRPINERVDRLERRDLVDGAEQDAKVLAKLVSIENELAAIRRDQVADRAAPRRAASVIAIALSTAIANLLAQWGLEPSQHRGHVDPPPIERRGP